jgi:flagellar protein FlaF
MSLRAYQQTAARAETPREAEYRLFGQVTRALMEAAKLDQSDLSGRMEALDWNRRLWSALAVDCAAPENTLPAPLRASIISLSIWVGKYTSKVIRGEDDIQDLIDINRMVMQGLSGQGGAAQAA